MKYASRVSTSILFVAIAGGFLSFSPVLLAAGSGGRGAATASSSSDDSTLQGDASGKLDKKQFKDVKVSVQSGVATLTGTVDVYEYKADAQRRVMHVKGVTAVRNDIEVGGPEISDRDLQKKLSEKLTYDPNAYGRIFDAITLNVSNGAVTLGGHAHDYVDRDSAVAIVSTTPGVKDIMDNIEVDPVSEMDNRIRLEVASAIYSFPSLNKYAINPARPIRVSVQNGNVELYGVVDSEADKDAANIRANGVSGVFSVKNYIQVANQPSEQKK